MRRVDACQSAHHAPLGGGDPHHHGRTHRTGPSLSAPPAGGDGQRPLAPRLRDRIGPLGRHMGRRRVALYRERRSPDPIHRGPYHHRAQRGRRAGARADAPLLRPLCDPHPRPNGVSHARRWRAGRLDTRRLHTHVRRVSHPRLLAPPQRPTAPLPTRPGKRPPRRHSQRSQGARRIRQPGQERVSRHHEPRDPHADERRDRHAPTPRKLAPGHRAVRAGRRRPARRLQPPRPHQRHPRPLQNREWQDRTRKHRIRSPQCGRRHARHDRPARRGPETDAPPRRLARPARAHHGRSHAPAPCSSTSQATPSNSPNTAA